ncbi:hypothetical protein [Agromyces sp. LHK192]|uniref:hypothetical protein n=1 Tax=Agromyces sp. LHK192 TaxID=2498704 RepID=UPI000FD98761|nr:hypothetical protein [Agromyces sp. LHK192]
MGELAHAAMLTCAVIGAAATLAAGRRVRPLDALAALVMLAAMLDTAGDRLVPAIGWACALGIAGVAIGIRTRADRARIEPSRADPSRVVPNRADLSPAAPIHAEPARAVPTRAAGAAHADLHHALALVVSGWLVAGALGHADGAAAIPTEPHGHAGPVLALQVLAVALLVASGAVVALRAWRTGRRGIRHGAMAASMTVMLAAMVVPSLLAAVG